MITEAYLDGYMNKEALSLDDIGTYINKNRNIITPLASGAGSIALAKALGAPTKKSLLYGLGGAAIGGGGQSLYNNREALIQYFKEKFGGDDITDKQLKDQLIADDRKARGSQLYDNVKAPDIIEAIKNQKYLPNISIFDKTTKDNIKAITNLH